MLSAVQYMPSSCRSVCPSYSGTVSKRLNIGSYKLCNTIDMRLYSFLTPKITGKYELDHYGGDKCKWGGVKLATFNEKLAITRKQYKIDA